MMDSWKCYINYILMDSNIEDVAIVSLYDKCVWVANPGGLLTAISPQEVASTAGQDQNTLLLTGITVVGKRCYVIRDNPLVDEDNLMDVGSKHGDKRSICIGKTPGDLIFLMGKEGVHGGVLNQKVYDMVVGMTARSK